MPDRVIFSVWDAINSRRIAVKRYLRRSDAARESAVLNSFRKHDHLVRFYGFFIRRRMGYVVMEWVPGLTLGYFARRHGPLEPKKAAAITLNLLEGLKTIHEHGYVHGDLHGQNVIISDVDSGRLKIIDFQHAVPIDREGRARALRRLPRPPLELAPESNRRIIDVRYDIYGAGFMCAQLLLGGMPRRRLRSTGRAGEPPIWEVVRKAAHRDPDQRFASAKEMMDALRSVVT